mmetsp:Transcript_11828/g.13753  ORF Transcript_11828/g.13753 Transcript_11828/m.13753 type:complete len:156 (-) Transcript_11828:140-607(-)
MASNINKKQNGGDGFFSYIHNIVRGVSEDKFENKSKNKELDSGPNFNLSDKETKVQETSMSNDKGKLKTQSKKKGKEKLFNMDNNIKLFENSNGLPKEIVAPDVLREKLFEVREKVRERNIGQPIRDNKIQAGMNKNNISSHKYDRTVAKISARR